MARDTFAGAKAEMLARLAPGGVSAAPSVSKVHDHEQKVTYPEPGKAVVTLGFGGKRDTEWTLRVRVYADASPEFGAAEALCAAATDEVDALLGSFGGSPVWAADYDPTLNAWFAVATVDLPREDF